LLTAFFKATLEKNPYQACCGEGKTDLIAAPGERNSVEGAEA
jgi:hypothetical protein